MEAGEIPDCGHMSGHVAAGEGPTDSLRRFSHKSPSLGTCRKAYIRKSGPLATILIQQSLGTTVTVHIHTFVGTQETAARGEVIKKQSRSPREMKHTSTHRHKSVCFSSRTHTHTML